jgi:tetratricopeptide (TPR) repeat protein
VIGATLLAPLALAQDHAPSQTETIDPDAQRLVQVLLGDDWKTSEQAAKALERRGVSGARAVLAQRARTRSARERDRLDAVLRDVVNALVVDIQRPLVSAPVRHAAQASLGDAIACIDPSGEAAISSEQAPQAEVDAAGAAGRDEPKTGLETRLRARSATAGLESLGPAALGLALEVPPVRPFPALRALESIAQDMYTRESARILAVARPADLDEAWHGRADLAAPFVATGLADKREPVRAFFQRIRDEAIALSLASLESEDPDRRECSQDELYRLSDMARPTLERIAKGLDKEHRTAEARVTAERLAHRIRFRLSKALVRRLGHELEGYSDLPFDKRRSEAFELERLGGPDAVPALRQLLVEEPTLEVQAVAAIGLFKQGDVVGSNWLQLHNLKFNRIATRDLAALILDQGNKYLQAKKYEQAEKQYLAVLELEPKNEIALYNLACAYSLWGKTDEAFVYLKKSIEAGFDDVSHMDKDTDLDPIRDDPRYKALLDPIRKKKAQQESGE